MQWCWKEGRCWGIGGTHHAGGLGSLLLQQASSRGMWDHLFVIQMQGGFHPVKMHYTAFDKTELVIKENLRIILFSFHMKCPSLSLITAFPHSLVSMSSLWQPSFAFASLQECTVHELQRDVHPLLTTEFCAAFLSHGKTAMRRKL